MEKISFFKIFNKISLKEKIFFTKNLAVMAKSGLSLAPSLEILAKQTLNKKFKLILENIKIDVEKGNSLTFAFLRYPEIFSELFINLVEAGEKSGKLEDALNQAAIQMKKNHELISKIKGALTYPLFVLGVMIIMGSVMFVAVIPKMMNIFRELNAPLPLATRILMATSDFASKYIFFILVFTVLIAIFLIRTAKTATGKNIFHKIILNLPIVSEIAKKINLAKFCRTFSSLLTTDIPIVQTLNITARTLGNVHYRKEIMDAGREIKRGKSIAAFLEKKPKLFPPLLTQMLKVGEQTGTLDTILNDLTLFYEQEVKDTLDNLTSLIEPILIVVLGVVVGGIAAAIILPMYSLTEAF